MMGSDIFSSTVENLRESGNFRSLSATSPDGLIDFSSNNYLGFGDFTLGQLLDSDSDAASLKMASSASRLLASDQSEYFRLESILESFYPGRKALVFNSGYHANVGIVSALATLPDSFIVADKLVHASIIDGLAGTKNRQRFAHNDFSHLRRIISRLPENVRHITVIVESVYSMDGDSPDLEQLLRLKREDPRIILYVDEAHAIGVAGPSGLGLVAATSAPGEVDITVGTFSKALGSFGAFALVSEPIRDFLINKARSLIFSTSLPPVVIRWTELMFRKMVESDSLRTRLSENSRLLYDALQEISPDPRRTPSHIAWLITGTPESATGLSLKLRSEGILLLPIRTPTVPTGTDRLRISLSAAHTPRQIQKLASALKTHYSR